MAKKWVKYKNCIILSIIIIIHTLILFLMCDFSKTLETYGDDFAYYSMAKSLFYGEGTQVHGVDFNFQNLAFSYYLVPFFLITDSVRRIQIISFCNAFLMSLSIIPLWLICKEFKLNKRFTWLVVAIIFVWPDMITAGTMMSENLYWVLSLFTFWLCIKSLNTDNLVCSGFAAVFSYISYWCKEVALCIPLAYVAISIIFPIFSKIIDKQKWKKNNWREEWGNIKRIIVYISVYAVLYLFFKYVIYSGGSSFYTHIIGLDFVKDLYSVVYFIYGFLYYILAAMIAFLVIPIVYPFVYIRKLDKTLQKSLLFIAVLLLGTLLVIVFTITVKEDLGRVTPRIHLRYFSSMIGVFLPIFLKSFELVEDDYEYVQKCKIRTVYCWGIIGILCLFGYKGVQGGCVNENLALLYSQFLSRKIPAFNNGGDQNITFYPTGMIVGTFLVIYIVLFNIIQLSKKLRRFSAVYFGVVSLVICGINIIGGCYFLRSAYSGETSEISEMKNINNYFKESDLIDSNVMYVASGWGAKNAKIYDTYFDGSNNYEISADTLSQMVYAGGGEDIVISESQFNEIVWGTPYTTESIDFFIVGKDTQNIAEIVTGLELIDKISGENYMVYRNVESNLINVKVDKEFEIVFTEDGYNANIYNVTGISYCEGTYSWTDGDELNVCGYVDSKFEEVNVCFELDNTFNGNQEIVVYQGNEVIYAGTANGNQNFSFHMKPVNGECSFRVQFPNAKSPSELGLSEDARKLAIALKKITIIGER